MDELFKYVSGEHWFEFGHVSNLYVAGLDKTVNVLIDDELLVKYDSQVPS